MELHIPFLPPNIIMRPFEGAWGGRSCETYKGEATCIWAFCGGNL